VKKYLRLTCTICKRSIDKLVDLTHYAPDECTITLNCEGRLLPIEYRSNAEIAVAPALGVTDWRPRGTKVFNSPTDTAPSLIALETGTLKQLTLGVALASDPGEGATHNVTFSVRADTPKAYRQYVYRMDQSFDSVAGVESGLEKKSLRFTAYGANPDLVEVYVNGVKRAEGTGTDDYQVYNGSNGILPNTIKFNSSIVQAGITQVDVIVSKEQASNDVTLTFTRNALDESRAGTGAYENVSYVDRFDETLAAPHLRRYYLFHLDLDTATQLSLNSILVSPSTNTDAIFLLARSPYSTLDRYTDLVVELSGMDEERDYIKFYAVNSVTTARVTQTAISTIYPPLTLGKFAVEKTIKTQLPGVTEQITIDGAVITGPDA